MVLCTVCSLNGKEKALYELMPSRSSNKRKRCAWCHISLEKNLKANFNMVYIQPKSEIGIDLTANFEPLCDSCHIDHSYKSDIYIEPKNYTDYNVNRKIICKKCANVLSYTADENSILIDTDNCIIYDSTLSIGYDNSSFIRKLFNCCCLFNCS